MTPEPALEAERGDKPNTPKEQAALKRGLDAAVLAVASHADGCGATQPHPDRSGWMGPCTCGLDKDRTLAAAPGNLHAIPADAERTLTELLASERPEPQWSRPCPACDTAGCEDCEGAGWFYLDPARLAATPLSEGRPTHAPDLLLVDADGMRATLGLYEDRWRMTIHRTPPELWEADEPGVLIGKFAGVPVTPLSEGEVEWNGERGRLVEINDAHDAHDVLTDAEWEAGTVAIFVPSPPPGGKENPG